MTTKGDGLSGESAKGPRWAVAGPIVVVLLFGFVKGWQFLAGRNPGLISPVLDSVIQAKSGMMISPRQAPNVDAFVRCDPDEAAIVWFRWTDQPPVLVDQATFRLFDETGSSYEVRRVFRNHDFLALAIYRGYARVPTSLTLRLRMNILAKHIDFNYAIPTSDLPPAMPRRLEVPTADPAVTMNHAQFGDLTCKVKPTAPEIKSVMVRLEDTSFYPVKALTFPLYRRSDGCFSGSLLATGAAWADAAKIVVFEAVDSTWKGELHFGSANLTRSSVGRSRTFARPELAPGPGGVGFELDSLLTSKGGRGASSKGGKLVCIIGEDSDPADGPPPDVTLSVLSPRAHDLDLDDISCIV